jgi:surface antigen
VRAWDGRAWCRRLLYNDSGTAALRLCRSLWARAIPVKPIAAFLSLLALSGCSYQLGSLVSSDDSGAQVTGTINPSAHASSRAVSKAAAAASPQVPPRGAPQASPQASALASPQAELDLAYARAAAAEALSRGNRDASLPWQNPHSGAGGNITPLATSYSEAGLACRDFLASYMHGGSQDWLEGAACQTASGSWQIRRLKPLKSS